jgi:hypothetical protein
MTLNEFIVGLAQISGLLFIVTSMLVMGMSLTIAQILHFKMRANQEVIVPKLFEDQLLRSSI